MDEQLAQIAHLKVLRTKIAAYSQALAERELTGRVLRLETEARLRTENAGISKTEAEKLAKADAAYLVHERRSIEISSDRDVALAEAEAVRLRLDLAIADLTGVP